VGEEAGSRRAADTHSGRGQLQAARRWAVGRTLERLPGAGVGGRAGQWTSGLFRPLLGPQQQPPPETKKKLSIETRLEVRDASWGRFRDWSRENTGARH
jgi:hypothetical protein